MTLLDRQKEFARILVKGIPEQGLKGLPLISACAIVGNGTVENKMNPVTLGPKDHGSDGVLQWRLDRLDGPHGLKGWAAQRRYRWDTLWTQAAFTLWELQRDYSGGLEKRLRSAPTKVEWNKETADLVSELTEDFCRVYERPNMAVAHLDLRKRHARSVLMLMLQEAPGTITQTATGTVIAVGAGTALTQDGAESGVILFLAFFIAAILWKLGAETKVPLAEFEEEAMPEITLPMEISTSPVAGYEAADANVKALEIELANARAKREEERIKVEQRARALLAAITPKENPLPTVSAKEGDS